MRKQLGMSRGYSHTIASSGTGPGYTRMWDQTEISLDRPLLQGYGPFHLEDPIRYLLQVLPVIYLSVQKMECDLPCQSSLSHRDA